MTQRDGDETKAVPALDRGSEVAHYRILAKLGAGGMGEVHLAEDRKLDRRVALKFLPAHLARDGDVRARFTREAQAIARLDHANVVTIYEVSEHDGLPFLAMQYIEGTTLADQPALSVEQITDLTAQIADGLAHAHAAGITHRDVKPANIVVDAQFRPVILDFGLATVLESDRLTKTGFAVGTAAYMSPEQAEGKTSDHRSDLFSLGIVLYELITGRLPFLRDGIAATLYAIVHDEVAPLQGVPAELENIVYRCLAKRPDERYQSASDLAAALRHRQQPVSRGAPTARPSIAVLPFANTSDDPDNEYFSDGLTEELIGMLARNASLRVIGRTSAFAFKGKQEVAQSIGQKLGVGTLLEGSVRKAANRIRVAVQLINAADGTPIWSEKYDRVLEDIFDVQDEIAGAVATALDIALLGSRTPNRPVNIESYDLILRAHQSAAQGTKTSVRLAGDMFQRAIELDANSARAWAGLARVGVMQGAHGFAAHHGAYAAARQAAQRALDLDDNLAEAHEVMGWIAIGYDLRLDEAGVALRNAMRLAPRNAWVVTSMAHYEGILCHIEESARLSRLSIELDPLNPHAFLQQGRTLLWARRLPEARAALASALSMSPGMTGVCSTLSKVLLLLGQVDEAIAAAEAEPPGGYRNYAVAIARHAGGDIADADQALAGLLEAPESWAFQIACVYAARNDSDGAFTYLERAIEQRDAGVTSAKANPLLQNLHDDDRWPALLSRLGLRP